MEVLADNQKKVLKQKKKQKGSVHVPRINK